MNKITLFNVLYVFFFALIVGLTYALGKSVLPTIFLTQYFMFILCFVESLLYPVLQKIFLGKNLHLILGLIVVLGFTTLFQFQSLFFYCWLISSQGFNDPESFSFFKIFLITSIVLSVAAYIVGYFLSRLVKR